MTNPFKRYKRKTASQVSSERVAMERMQRYNPLRNLTPDYLRSAHEEFNAGRLKMAAKLWDAIERTDDVCQVAAAKRKKAISRHGYEIVPVDDSPEAARHADVLQFFYDNLIATRADDRNVRGGFPMALRHMMDAAGKRYAAHEIVWRPIDGGLTAELVFVPLWYFENTTGELRLLNGLSDLAGAPLDPGGWIINSGDGIMEAVGAAYLFKHLPLQDWLFYSEKFGMPIPIGKSPDMPGSDGWAAMEDAVAAVGSCDGVVISNNGELTFESASGTSNMPQPALVERMDRAIASLWRGADLGTLSKGDGTGASLQGDETDLLEDDDAANLSDVLNEQLDRFVILYATGATTPLAWVKVKGAVREDIETDLNIDKTLAEIGVVSPVDELERRYGRTGLVEKSTAAPPMNLPNEAQGMAEIGTLKKNARGAIAEAIALDYRPIAARIADILDTASDDELQTALETFRDEELPEMMARILDDPTATTAYEDALTAALFNGYLGDAR